jgi:hypothetical protein
MTMFMYDYPDWGFSRAFTSVVKQIPGWYPQRRCTARTLPNFLLLLYAFLCCSMYCLFCDVLCIVCVYMCTEQLPPGGYPIAVKYIISYNTNTRKWNCWEKNLFRCRFTHHYIPYTLQGGRTQASVLRSSRYHERTVTLPVCPFWKREKYFNPNFIKQWALSVHHPCNLSERKFVFNKIRLFNFLIFLWLMMSKGSPFVGPELRPRSRLSPHFTQSRFLCDSVSLYSKYLRQCQQTAVD